jgi:hypothetical protein
VVQGDSCLLPGIVFRCFAMDVPAFRQSCTVCHRVSLHLLCKPSGAIAFSSARPSLPSFRLPSPHNADQVVERMVDFVGKGQQLGGRWLKLSARVAFVSVTVLNAINLAFMAVYSYFCVQG